MLAKGLAGAVIPTLTLELPETLEEGEGSADLYKRNEKREPN